MPNEKMQKKSNTFWISSLGILTACFFILVCLITAIEAVVYWTPGYFEREYSKYAVLNDLPEMTMENLLEVTDEMMAYLRGNREDLHVFTIMGGEYREFFNAREIAHMEDVRELFIAGLWLRRIGIGIACIYAAVLAFWCKGRSDRKSQLQSLVPSSLCLGTGIFFSASLILAAVIASDFSRYFIVFHHIFFDNDLWLLDPATDMLINIVPEPFFMDTAFRIGIVFACMVMIFFIVCFLLWKRGRKIH